ncbi:MAG: FG-GAP repeat domain-containing protein, partial [Thermoanaerobaculia bacterium]
MRLRRWGGFAAFLVWPAALFPQGDGSFQGPLKITDVPNPVAVAAGDFNRDGKPDLATVNGSESLTVLLQDPASRLEWARPTLLAGTGSFFIRAADFDADGDDDLAVADPTSYAHVLVCRGDGSFDKATPLRQAQLSRWIAFGDLNGDGKLDLASANWNSLTVSIYHGGGDGTFAFAGNLSPGGEPHAIEVIDYNGDAVPDLMVGLGSQDGMVPFQGKRGAERGQFLIRPKVNTLGCVRYLAAGDFNGDGKTDLATSCELTGTVFAGTSAGDGSFRRTLSGRLGIFMAIADLNGDGAQDLALTKRDSTNLDVYPGKGDGNFHPAAAFRGVGENTSFLIASDLDRNGLPDLITADSGSSTLTVFWGKRGERFLETGYYLGGFDKASSLSVADFDGDGAPDIFISHSTQPQVQLHRTPAPGSAAAPPLAIATASAYTALEAVDLDGDRTPDLAGVNLTSGRMSVALLDPAGRVRQEISLPACALPTSVAAARVDEDDRIDLLATCLGDGQLALFLALEGGGYAPARLTPTAPRARKAAAADLDADGHQDVAVAGATLIAVHYGKGGGELSEPVPVFENVSLQFTGVAAADLHRDGHLDLVVVDRKGSNVIVLAGKGSRAFEAPLFLKAGATPLSVAIADLNRDGYPDITTGNASSSASAFLNRSGRGFTLRSDYPLPAAAVGHEVADFDLDGTLDLLAVSASSALILYGRPEAVAALPFRRGDVDGDGKVEINDPIVHLQELFLGGAPVACEDAADANDDG